MTHSFPYSGEDFCIIHGREHMRSTMGNPIPWCEVCEERRCQKCGIATGGEEVYVSGRYWCHPCADACAIFHEER